MKKGFFVVFVVLALVVIVAPGIVGMLAEKSVDQQIEWAEVENRDLKITATSFDRGWFSSQGQHRIELQNSTSAGELKDILGLGSNDPLPVLIVDTRLNHGPLAMSGGADGGALKPGLGNAVSALSVETSDGRIIELPGEVYSSLSLAGDLTSSYKTDAGATDNATWSDIRVDFDSTVASGAYSYDGDIASLQIADGSDSIAIENFRFSGDLEMSEFNFVVGNVRMAVDGMSIATAGQAPFDFGPLLFETNSAISNDRVNSKSTISMTANNVPALGTTSMDMRVTVDGVDAAALKRLINKAQTVRSSGNGVELLAAIDQELLEVLVRGADMRIEQLDIALPQGTVKSTFNFKVKEVDDANPEWTSLLLATEADANMEFPEMIVDMAMLMAPNADLIEQFLIKNGDVYEVEAAYKKGLMTVNGVPMALPVR